MNTIFRAGVAGLLLVGAMAAASASTVTWAGSLSDAGNAALVGSDLAAPDFTDDNAIANNVALVDFDVLKTGVVTLVGTGYGAGGIDPYLSLFAGSGPTAVFVASNDQMPTQADFTYSGTLDAGHYRLAIGTFENMSFAEQDSNGTGTLSEGFIGLGEPGALGNGTYRVTLTTPVPEPAPAALLAAGGLALALRSRRARAPARA